MKSVSYSPQAVTDLVRLREFIAEKNPTAASRIAAELIARIDNLSRFPQMGRPVPRAPQPETLRDMVFGRYVIRYSIHAENLIILRIWHHYENRD